MSIRELVVGALHNEMALEASGDPDLLTASGGGRVVTPSGMVLDGSKDKINPPPAPDDRNGNEIDPALVDHLEFYLLNYFKPGHGEQTEMTEHGRRVFNRTRKVKGRTIAVLLSEPEVGIYQEWIQNNRRLDRLVREMRQLSARALTIQTGRTRP